MPEAAIQFLLGEEEVSEETLRSLMTPRCLLEKVGNCWELTIHSYGNASGQVERDGAAIRNALKEMGMSFQFVTAWLEVVEE